MILAAMLFREYFVFLEDSSDSLSGVLPQAMMMQAFGGAGVNVTTPDELSRAVNEAMDSGKPTLVNAVIDPQAGTESGRIGNLNPQSVVSKT